MPKEIKFSLKVMLPKLWRRRRTLFLCCQKSTLMVHTLGMEMWKKNLQKVSTTCKFQITLKMFAQWYLRNVELTFQSFAIMCLCPNFSFSYFFLFWSAKIPLDFLNWKLTLLFISLWLSLDYECCIYSSQDIFKKTFQSALSVLLTYTSYSRRKEETKYFLK